MTHPAPIQMLLASFALATSAAYGAAPLRNGFDIRVPQPPTRVTVMGSKHLSYEVHLVNFSDRALAVTEWELVNGSSDHALAKLEGDALKSHIALVGESTADGNAQVGPGCSAVIYVDVDVPDGASTSSLQNRIRYRTSDSNDSTIVSRPMPLAAGAASVIGPPLRGGWWIAIHSSAWPRGHRRVFYSVAGRTVLPGRFAIDWVRVDDEGRVSAGDPDIAASQYGYGADVIAVADGVITAVRDGMSEPARVSQRTKHAPEEDAGNYVALRLPDGRYAMYEHLKRGSVHVAVGDHVRRGQTLASLGFSGESTGPHLHFHVADSDSPLDAEGLPFAIDRFDLLGRYEDIGALGRDRWAPRAGDITEERKDEWPDENVVVRFRK